jgi:thiopurine S-methyltransferase
MEISYWESRWKNNRIGFHSPEPNPRLVQLRDDGRIGAGMNVLIPLCGKSVDMKWLADRGIRVTGVEASELPCRDFFREQDLDYTESRSGDFTVYNSGMITIMQGDFFRLPPSFNNTFDAVFDRAALVALPPEKRKLYSARLTSLCRAGAVKMLISYEYDQDEMAGPPFAVPVDEVAALYAGSMSIEIVDNDPVDPIPERFARRGLRQMRELTILMNRL